jgi:hypothetical protein
MAKASAMRPGSGGGPIQNAKAQSKQQQSFGKAKPVASKHPSKKAGLSGDGPRSRKGSALAAAQQAANKAAKKG